MEGRPRGLAIDRALGEPVGCSLATAPAEYAGRVRVESDVCAVCGSEEGERVVALASVAFARGFRVGFGVRVHRACFDLLADAEGPAPVPW
jgi:hypothetical protein